MRIISIFISLFVCLSSLAHANLPMMPQEEEGRLVIHNRVLAKVNGKTISVLDLIKKMDVFLARHYPHLVNSLPARYQFYTTHWQEILDQTINTELMLADAEIREVKVNDGEVRETLQERFGPNVMENLEKIGISYEEAREMVHADMIVQRMSWLRVTSKALPKVGSQEVKAAYRDFCEKNPPKEEWKYQVLTIRAEIEKEGELLAAKASTLLAEKAKDLEIVADALKQEKNSPKTSISLSQIFQVSGKDLSQAHKEILTTLEKGAFSKPTVQVSRSDRSKVYRLFHLMDYSKHLPPPFEKVANQLKDALLEEEVAKENSQYITRLRDRFGYNNQFVQEPIPADFQPFSIK